jgi:hypothetical protein
MADNQKSWALRQMAWSSIVTVFAVIAVGFSWFSLPGFDWVTQGGANQMVQSAVTERLVPICVAQARLAPAADLTIFQATDVWQRRDLVEAKGWATMPGSSSPESAIAQSCAELLYNDSTPGSV